MNKYSVERWKCASAPNEAELKDQLESEGYAVFLWSDAPGSVYPPHKHKEFQTHWIISGKLELNIEGVGIFRLEPGDRDFMPAETLHSARVIGSDSVRYLIGSKEI